MLPFCFSVKRIPDALEEIKDKKDDTHRGDLVGRCARALEYQAKRFQFEEIDMLEDQRHTVDDGMD